MSTPPDEVIAWLLNAVEPWTVYNTLLHLVGKEPDSAEVRAAYQAMQQHPRVATLIASLDSWPPQPLDKAYNPKDSIWQLNTLADFGLRRDDPRIAAIATRIFAAQADEGGFLHGGFSHTKTWDTRPYICVDHVQTYALACFGYLDDPRLQQAYAHIQAWHRLDGGWHPNKLNLPGNGRETEPSCPFGTVNVLRALTANPDLCQGELAQQAAEFLLSCWQRRQEPYRPVGFGIGTTWHKLQYPFVKYQLLKTADTLARIPSVRQDGRFLEMVAAIQAKQSSDGHWTAESVNKPYSEFDFGQKKRPSSWITFLAWRIIASTTLQVTGY